MVWYWAVSKAYQAIKNTFYLLLYIKFCRVTWLRYKRTGHANEIGTVLMSPSIDLAITPPDGPNRAVGHCAIAAQSDREAIALWIASRAHSEHTRQLYIRHADRFHRWSVMIMAKPISAITPEDLLHYRRFLLDPPAGWISTRKYSREHPQWRPFERAQTPASVRVSMTILAGMFAYLVEAGYLQHNIFSLAKKEKLTRRNAVVQRVVSTGQIDEIGKTIEALPRDMHYHRSRWLFALLGLTGLRISEAVNATMGQVFQDGEFSFLRIVGKGDKEREIPLPGLLMQELGLFRQSLSKTDDSTPLLGSRMTRQHAHRIIKRVLELTADRLRAEGREEEAVAMARPSAHWWRHTYATTFLDAGVDMRTVRDNLGHASISTTSLYSHRDRRERAADVLRAIGQKD